jgi:hypothetical protein
MYASGPVLLAHGSEVARSSAALRAATGRTGAVVLPRVAADVARDDRHRRTGYARLLKGVVLRVHASHRVVQSSHEHARRNQ